MSRVCEVTGKKVMHVNNVSHAHNKTRRKFDINLQMKTFWVDVWFHPQAALRLCKQK